MKIEIYASSNLDLLRESLQTQLTTRQLVDFAFSLGDNYYKEEEFYKALKEKLGIETVYKKMSKIYE